MINPITSNTNFRGAYIVKGPQKAVTRFENEITTKKLLNKNLQVMTMPLTENYHNNQPYAELLVCTGENIKNLKSHLQKTKKQQEKNLKRFVSKAKTRPFCKKITRSPHNKHLRTHAHTGPPAKRQC